MRSLPSPGPEHNARLSPSRARRIRLVCVKNRFEMTRSRSPACSRLLCVTHNTVIVSHSVGPSRNESRRLRRNRRASFRPPRGRARSTRRPGAAVRGDEPCTSVARDCHLGRSRRHDPPRDLAWILEWEEWVSHRFVHRLDERVRPRRLPALARPVHQVAADAALGDVPVHEGLVEPRRLRHDG